MADKYLFFTPHPPSLLTLSSLHPLSLAQKLQLALRIIAEFKEVFEEYRARAVAEVGPQAWSPAPKSLFLRLVCSPLLRVSVCFGVDFLWVTCACEISCLRYPMLA
jgi:hypothetical protein